MWLLSVAGKIFRRIGMFQTLTLEADQAELDYEARESV
jgi:hypothetical protein